ncbi:hypothetical protein NK8_59810 (plasmid) [Caballeronia sp. NK8]|uniref:hypothetical protein n=1 Tax=Caballeronia sp. NK8 TaxID=140098 RepID=UPI001BB67309|nr:hypothetical protein [Caballeronia sp. NK8]BCQ27792.1 hypothetical protein NK8_59810 [Caballeronia sp. NK8]
MKYFESGKIIKIGDSVFVEKGVQGVVVCDFDSKQCVSGYEDWFTSDGSSVEGIPTQGILVKTDKYGLIHYETEDESIKKKS